MTLALVDDSAVYSCVFLARSPFQTRLRQEAILNTLADPNPSDIPGSDIYQPLPHW